MKVIYKASKMKVISNSVTPNEKYLRLMQEDVRRRDAVNQLNALGYAVRQYQLEDDSYDFWYFGNRCTHEDPMDNTMCPSVTAPNGFELQATKKHPWAKDHGTAN